jgi:hypothetical protein
MIWSVKQTVIPFGCAIALELLAAWSALVARPAAPFSLATTRHSRRHPLLQEQEPPAWLIVLARAVLVLALAALGFATSLDCVDGSH